MKNASPLQQWLSIGLILGVSALVLPNISDAGCPYARKARKTCPVQTATRSSSDPLIINVEGPAKRCPKGQHVFKGNCIENTILDSFDVCNPTNCTESCPGCRKKTVSCFPRPDNKDINICIDCKINKHCRKGYLCDNYRCVPSADYKPKTMPGPAAQPESQPH